MNQFSFVDIKISIRYFTKVSIFIDTFHPACLSAKSRHQKTN